MIVFTYLSINLIRIEEQRNVFTLQELARPYGDVSFINLEFQFEILLRNVGLGPMLISKILILDNHNRVLNNITELTSKLPNSSYCESRNVVGEYFALGKDVEIYILRIVFKPEDPHFVQNKENVRILLNTYSLEIKFYDIYKRPIDTIKERISIGVRNV